jgi:starch phosphorylase
MAVFPSLPERLSRLHSLAYNLWWAWNPQAQQLYKSIDAELWEQTTHNAVRLLAEVQPARLEELAHNSAFLDQYDAVLQAFDAYMHCESTWYHQARDQQLPGPIAYFSAEFGLHESLPIYSGGLGVLAGDHCKEASDLGLPFVGMGFLYPQGYFRQRISRTGKQEAIYERLNFGDLPAEIAKDPQGREAMINLELNGRQVYARIWKFQIGRNPLYLMDTDVEQNDPRDRVLSARLYGGDTEMRIAQEIVLGIGGVRALRTLGITPSIWHMNESHSAFVSLERIRELVEGQNITFNEALKIVASNAVFTTHTPVPAGNDVFSFGLMDEYFRDYSPHLGITRDQFVNFARQDQSWGPSFSMTVLAIKSSSQRNGVSKLHGDVSRHMWQFLWPDLDFGDVPIGHITNGIHSPTWIAPELKDLFARYIDANWLDHVDEPAYMNRVLEIPSYELWQTHVALKQRLIDYARKHHQQRSDRLGEGSNLLPEGHTFLNPDALTIGFARRFATYKRATLFFRDRERVLKLLNMPGKPVQIIFAGKAHPADEPGQSFITMIEQYTRDPEFAGKVVLLEEYDMDMARHLVSGADIWLNNPIRPYEASGTSGQKAALNGIPNCSILDGWWAEGFDGHNGWSIGDEREYNDPEVQANADADSLYTLLERQIVPTFFDFNSDGVPHNWIRIMKESIRTCGPQYSMKRMVKEYVSKLYYPASVLGHTVTMDQFKIAKDVSAWESRVRAAWPTVSIEADGPHDVHLNMNETAEVTAKVKLGTLTARDVAVELVWGKDDNGQLSNPSILQMERETTLSDGRQVYRIRFNPQSNGSLLYGVRIRPDHPALSNPHELGLQIWA